MTAPPRSWRRAPPLCERTYGETGGIGQEGRDTVQPPKRKPRLVELAAQLQRPLNAWFRREGIESKVSSLISSHGLDGLIYRQVSPLAQGTFTLEFWIDEDQFNRLKDNWFGRRVLITNRHEWSTAEILFAHWGQAEVEYAFKNLRNPFHLALRPQYHWSDQKIEVHAFVCFIAFLLSMVAYRCAREKADFQGSTHTLLEKLSAIRLATLIESPKEKTKGRYKVAHSLEEMDPDIQHLAEAIGVTEPKPRSSIPFSVYTEPTALS